MGVYLSSPIVEKVSDDKQCSKFNYGASSMQGWRMTQEDAHNCISDYDSDKNTSYFAVYDGHGGAEVAQYTASHLPDFIKNHMLYKEDKLAEALQEAFLDFDALLTQDSIVQELKILAGVGDDDENEVADDEGMGRNERDILIDEAHMPLEQLMAKYNSKSTLYNSAPPVPAPAQLQNLQKDKHQSPFIKAKRSSENGDGDKLQPSGSGTDQLSARLEVRLENEQPDNDNNLNVEKELRDSQSAVQTTKGRTIEPDSSTASARNHLQSKRNNSNPSETKTPALLTENGELSVNTTHDSSEQTEDKSASKCGKSESVEPDSTSDKDSLKSQETCSSSASTPKQEVEVSQSGSTSSAALKSSPPTSSSSKAGGSGSDHSISDSGVGSSSLVAGSSSASVQGSSSCSSAGSSGAGSSGTGSSVAAGSSANASSSSCEAEGSGIQAGGSGLCKPSSGTKSLVENFDSDDTSDDNTSDDDDEYMSASDDDDDDDDDEDEEVGENGGIFGARSVPAGADEDHVEEPGTDSGCTAVVVLMREDKIFVANAGDSRCVLCRGGTAVELSFDHKPEDQVERSRIEGAGGKVTNDGRVNGGLNLSRALGDHWYKRNESKTPREQMISALPDIESTTIEEQDEFLVIACDGIWNYLTSQETVDFVRERLKDPAKFEKPSRVCEELFDHCLAPNTMGDGTGCDNMTCVIVALRKSPDIAATSGSAAGIKRDNTEVDKSDVPTQVQHEKRAKLETDEPEALDT